jgi:glucose/arabinose dehydrogenase
VAREAARVITISSRALPVLVSAVLVLGSCSDDEPSADTSGTLSSEAVTTTQPSTTGGTDSPDTTGTTSPPTTGEVTLTEVASVELLSALSIHAGSGDLFVAQRDGIVRVYDPASEEMSDPVLDITGDTEATGERGLLGIAVAPEGDFLYLHYTNNDGDTRVHEFPLDGRSVDSEGRREVLALEQPFPNHNGGQLSFGPDGYLYLGLGDGGSGGDPLDSGQDRTSLLGKILRIDPTAGDPYGIPDDNPFGEGDEASEVWVYGVRNPWRFSWDRETGDLWVADVGQGEVEEIDRLPVDDDGTAGRGANLGWNRMEGNEPFQGQEPPDHTPPVFTYGHDEGCSVTGGYVYRGEGLPFLEGVYVFGDYCTSQLWGLRLDDGGTVVERIDLGVNVGANQLVSFGEDADGELYVLTDGGSLLRLDAA